VSTDGVAISPTELERHAEMWRPWRGYAALHLFERVKHEADVRGNRETTRLRKMPSRTMRNARAS
jgi:3-methyladenine DNA glycosylase/8-oxoguanine DNA glycosylase